MHQNLPYRYDVLQSPIYRYTSANPPSQPQLPDMFQDMRYYLPEVCAVLANIASEKAQNTAPRRFTFNQLSYNNWGNADWADVVKLAFDIIDLNVSSGVYQSIEM